jgi:hypothetical protein
MLSPEVIQHGVLSRSDRIKLPVGHVGVTSSGTSVFVQGAARDERNQEEEREGRQHVGYMWSESFPLF